jgi:secretion/DNA translocation related TadE-like protein
MTRQRLRGQAISDPGHGDAGSGVIWVLAMVAVVVLAAIPLLGIAEVRVARSRAATAADLAALAAAALLPDPIACTQAERIATAHRTRLVGCRVAGLTVDVEVTALVPWRWGSAEVSARSRAGPPAVR